MIPLILPNELDALLAGRTRRLDDAVRTVAPILEDVRTRGDQAVLDYARKFDAFDRPGFQVPAAELGKASYRLKPEFRDALKVAAANIRVYAQHQMPTAAMRAFPHGRRLGHIVRPLDTVAAYIPGGRYPLPSTLMMTVIPAQVARVRNVVVTCPRPSRQILGTAWKLRVSAFYQLGGAHAIAAFAYGTETIPKADRIVGPGNIYVAAAKKLLAGEVGIDFVAGPTEIVIVASSGNPAWIAADMLAQAEHDVDASAILLTTSKRLARRVVAEIERQLFELPTKEVATQAIDRNSAVVTVSSLKEAIAISNRIAPEHLWLPDDSLLAEVEHAGSIFIGPYSPEAAGDYASGPNHVLPTAGAARLRGGLSAADFVKIISIQQLTREGLDRMTPTITQLARAEGLEAHARSVEIRRDVAADE